ncbi:hypothetical protein WJ66_03926 [Stenotrophomonas maltophilia WJ66]|nr:hypothetical protein WJ66_03926 [Stenotrophomonas maltophilia WJ66]
MVHGLAASTGKERGRERDVPKGAAADVAN